jgi:hypothetical protein
MLRSASALSEQISVISEISEISEISGKVFAFGF